MNNGLLAGVVLAGVVAAGCNVQSQDVARATAAAAPAASAALDRDALAAQQYARVQQSFAERRTGDLQLAAYALAPVGDVDARAEARARALGLRKAGGLQQPDGAVAFIDGARELRIDGVSGTERYVDHARFHQGEGVAALPLTEAEYVSRAREHMLRVMPEMDLLDLRPYKVRRYMNDSAGPQGERSGPTTYQVAVAFNEVIDGMPVIGSSGKVVVHMTPAGEVLSHEATVRPVAQRVAAISGAEMVEPEVARRQVEERLAQRGVKMSDYTLTRAELGYLRLGRHSAQSVLAPHYAFFFEPVSRDVVGKKLVETIPAVTSAGVLQRLSQDEQVEAQRLAARHSRAGAEDTK